MSGIPPRASPILMAMNTRFTVFVIFLCAAVVMAGCIPFPILPGSDVYKTEDDIQELVENNANRNDVITELGTPGREYESVISYKVCRNTAGIGYILCVPYACDSAAFVSIDCFELILEFDENQSLIAYKKLPFEDDYKTPDRKIMEVTKTMEKTGIPESEWKQQVELGLEADEMIWLYEIKMHTIRSMEEAESAEEMYRIYLGLSYQYIEPVAAWESLCKAADEGYEKAQIEVAYWHRESNWEFARPNRVEWLRKAEIRADDRISYLWYTLAAKGDDKRLSIRDNLFSETLSENEMAEAKDMVNKWKPGQCPRPNQ